MDESRDLSGGPLEARLAAWFATEVADAHRDLAARARPISGGAAVGGRRWRHPSAGWRTATVAIGAIAVVALLGLASRPWAPDGHAASIAPGSSAASPGPSAAGPGASAAVGGPSTAPSPSAAAASPNGIVDRAPDGIPSQLSDEPVHRPGERVDGTGTWLLGGWIAEPGAFLCPLITADARLSTCPPYLVADRPPDAGATQRVVMPFALGKLPIGPVVLRVRPIGDDCPYTDGCGDVLEILEVVWAGDAATGGAPLDVMTAVARLRSVEPALTVTVRDPSRAGDCDAGWPAQTWIADQAPEPIVEVLIFPDVAQARAAAPRFSPSGYVGTTASGATCFVTTDSFWSSAWIRQDDVLVQVRVHPERTAADMAMVASVRRALATP